MFEKKKVKSYGVDDLFLFLLTFWEPIEDLILHHLRATHDRLEIVIQVSKPVFEWCSWAFRALFSRMNLGPLMAKFFCSFLFLSFCSICIFWLFTSCEFFFPLFFLLLDFLSLQLFFFLPVYIPRVRIAPTASGHRPTSP